MKRMVVLALTGLLASSFSVDAQAPAPKEGPKDISLSGVFSPNRVKSDMEADAKKAQDAGTAPFARGRKYYFSWGANPAEFVALGRNAIFLLATWTRNAAELPVKRFFIRAEGRDLPVYKISSWRTDVPANLLAHKMYGPNREDGFYLVPFGGMLKKGQIIVDLSTTRTDWVLLELPSNVATAASANKYPDAASNSKPDLKTLQAFIQRKFPGFPVPRSLP